MLFCNFTKICPLYIHWTTRTTHVGWKDCELLRMHMNEWVVDLLNKECQDNGAHSFSAKTVGLQKGELGIPEVFYSS